MNPDYTKYDAKQLQQVLRTIDATRFPDRVEEIKARLAALELSERMNPAAPAAPVRLDRSLDLPILRRVGTVLIVIGVIDIAAMIYFISNGQSYSSSLNIFALVAGIFIRRGGMRASSLVRWAACATLPAMAFMAIASYAMQPFDLTLTQLRLFPGASFASAALVIGYCALAIWVVRELGREPVLAARAAAGRPLRNMRIPFALGLVGVLVGAGLMMSLLGGKRADRAQAAAAEKLGADYRYHVNSMNIVSNNGATAVSASVVAWNANAVINVPVEWKE
jgi:uncharacterized protein YjeT (DUF2065 family)